MASFADGIFADGRELTTQNAHELTLFHLRQELTRRGWWNGADYLDKKGRERISFEAVLKRTITLLLEQENAAEQARAEAMQEGDDVRRERLALEKAARKAEAVERSRLRQEERKQQREAEELTKAAAEDGEQQHNTTAQAAEVAPGVVETTIFDASEEEERRGDELNKQEKKEEEDNVAGIAFMKAHYDR
jgi:hypothetical protein